MVKAEVCKSPSDFDVKCRLYASVPSHTGELPLATSLPVYSSIDTVSLSWKGSQCSISDFSLRNVSSQHFSLVHH